MESHPPPARRTRVLVVDDDAVVRRLFDRSLTSAGYDVVTAADGAEGWDILRRDGTIGLVLLDLMMPGMDGWRFRHAQRQVPALEAIPVIVVTGSPLEEVVHEELQAADYLRKPVAVAELLAVVQRHCPGH